MSALIHRPCASLSEWVDCLWLWEGYPAPASRERALPSGTLDLVINLEENRQRAAGGAVGRRRAHAARTRARGAERQTTPARARGRLARTAARGPGPPSPAHPGVAAFEDPGLASVAEVRQRTGLSAKRLIALFADEVGLTPKAFWRVRRFQAALRAVERRTPGDAALALGLGYFDQAHFDRELRHFTGLSPRAYRAEAIERPNHVQLRG